METLLKSQYDRLSPEKMVHLRQQLQDFATAYDGRLSVGTACSGTDVLIHVLADWLVPWWNKTFGLSIEVDHAFSCEVVEWKASWILAHFKPRYLFSDLFDLAKDTARDLISNGLAPVPSVSCFACGVECDTLSQLNNHRDPDCVSTGTGKTGTTAVACFQYLRRHRPQFFFVENVRTLASESKASSSCRIQQSKNPLQLITEWANHLGYVISSHLLDSCHYGVPQSRPRYYVFGFFVGNERSEPGTGFNQTDEVHSEELGQATQTYWHSLPADADVPMRPWRWHRSLGECAAKMAPTVPLLPSNKKRCRERLGSSNCSGVAKTAVSGQPCRHLRGDLHVVTCPYSTRTLQHHVAACRNAGAFEIWPPDAELSAPRPDASDPSTACWASLSPTP